MSLIHSGYCRRVLIAGVLAGALVVPGLAWAAPAEAVAAAAALPQSVTAATPGQASGKQGSVTASHVAANEAAPEAGQEGGWLATSARVVNFAALVGILVYFLRSPTAQYLSGRSDTIRRDLVEAKSLRDTAAAELQTIERRLAALPGELDALRRRGQEDLAAESRRMQETTARERDRLLDRAHKEIDAQMRMARRELTEHTADLAVSLARRRIEHTITPDDHARLIDRYAAEVQS